MDTTPQFQEKTPFKAFLPMQPVSKSVDVEKDWYVTGYATTQDLDLQDDIIDPQGINIDWFLEKGIVNYEHQQGDEFKVGRPTENCYVDLMKGLYVEAKLDKINPYAKYMWDKALQLEKTGTNEKLGFSIEGFALARNKQDTRVIEEVAITNVALTENPANPQATWGALLKSMTATGGSTDAGYTTGHETNPSDMTDGASLRVEALAGSIINLSYTLDVGDANGGSNDIWRKVGEYLDKSDGYSDEKAVIFMQLAYGMSRSDAMRRVAEN